MAHLVREIEIELDRKRKLRLDFKAAKLFKELTGKSLMRGGLATEDFDEDTVLALLYACLKHDDPELTQEQLAELIDYGIAIDLVANHFPKLFGDFLPEPKEAVAEEATTDEAADAEASADPLGGARPSS